MEDLEIKIEKDEFADIGKESLMLVHIQRIPDLIALDPLKDLPYIVILIQK